MSHRNETEAMVSSTRFGGSSALSVLSNSDDWTHSVRRAGVRTNSSERYLLCVIGSLRRSGNTFLRKVALLLSTESAEDPL